MLSMQQIWQAVYQKKKNDYYNGRENGIVNTSIPYERVTNRTNASDDINQVQFIFLPSSMAIF